MAIWCKTSLKSAALIALFYGLSACGSISLSDTSSSAKASRAVALKDANTTEAPDLARLGASRIPSGKCGMLLWTLSGQNPELVFRSIQGEGAEMVIDGQMTRLQLVRLAGETRFGIASEQDFMTPEEGQSQVKASVKAPFGLSFTGGVYVEKGMMTLVNDEGWERVMPVAGLAGCRS